MVKKILSGVLSAAMIISAIPPVSAAETAKAKEIAPARVEYSFDDDSTGAKDSSGNSRDGKIFGTTEFSDDAVSGRSLLLKGGYVLMPEDIVNGANYITISIWTKPMRAKEDSRLWDIGSNDQNFLNLFAPLAGNKYASALRIDNSAVRAESESGAFAADQWQQLTVTYTEANNGLLTIYKNGGQIAQLQTGGRKVSQLGMVTNATIGRAQFPKDPDYYGYIDDFIIYDKALSAAEISERYSSDLTELAQTAADRLDIAALNGIKSLAGVSQDLKLPSSEDIKDSGLVINWKSNSPNIIRDDGKLSGGVGTALLSAVITNGADVTVTRDFELTVTKDAPVIDPPGAITTAPGLMPKLPELVTANDGKQSLSVEWEKLSADDCAFAGTKTVAGVASNGAAVSVTVNIDDSYIKNPIIEQGSAGGSPDPYIAHYNGYYYYVRHNYNVGLTVSKAKRLQDIEAAPRIVVYNAPASGMYSKEYWAPEIFFIDGNWYIYVAADNGNNANHRMYCLKSTDPADPQAPYEMMGKVAPTSFNDASGSWEVKQDEDKWAIDGTVLEDVNGKNYFVWSGWEGNVDGQQNLYIAEMLNPYTLKGSRVLLNTPSAPWERKQLDGDCLVNEGPQTVKHGDKIHIIYSANHSGRDVYCLGSLTMSAGSNPLEPDSWTKSEGPLFTQSLDPADQSYGTGHAMITESPDGKEQYLIYHAFQSSGGAWIDRSARAVKISWDKNYPVFGNPVAPGILMPAPSGSDSEITVGKYEAESAALSGGAVKTAMNRPSGGHVVSGISKKATVEFEITAPKSGEYLISFMGNSRISSGKCYQDVTVNGTKYKISHSGTNNDAGIWRPSSDAENANGDGLYAALVKGRNLISVTQSPDSSGAADLDYLYLTYFENGSESIQLSDQTKTLNIGESFKLTAKVLPETAPHSKVVWKSGDSSTATVDQNGIVTALAAGETAISVRPYNNAQIETMCTITVNPKPVTSVSLNKTSVTAVLGTSFNLTATVLPANATNKTVKWSSSNNRIAAVGQNGRVTAVSPGVTTITAESSNSLKAYCTVKVTPAPVTSVKLSLSKVSLSVKQTRQLRAIVSPKTAGQRVLWSSSNSRIASVSSSGKITAKKAGAAVITAAAGGKSTKCSVTVKPRAASKIKLSKSGKRLLVKFKKGAGATASKLIIYRNGKRFKTVTVKGSSYKFKAKKGTYKVKITSTAKVGRKTYSGTAKTSAAKKVK